MGSAFTLYLPQTYAAPPMRVDIQRATSIAPELPTAASETDGDVTFSPASITSPAIVEDLVIEDDRNVIQRGDPVLLIIEDDIAFARILVDLAHERGLKAIVALRGGTALSLAREFTPGAITLDIALPDMAGWTILDRLKHDPATRHIPVHVISGDENRRRSLALGAMTYLEKSVTKDALFDAFRTIHYSVQRAIKKLLVVTADGLRRTKLNEVLKGPDIEVLGAASGGEALAIIKQECLDGIVIDLRLNARSIRLPQESVTLRQGPFRGTALRREKVFVVLSHSQQLSFLRRALQAEAGTPPSLQSLFASDAPSCGSELPLLKPHRKLPVGMTNNTPGPNQLQTALLVQLHRPADRDFEAGADRKLMLRSKQHAGTANVDRFARTYQAFRPPIQSPIAHIKLNGESAALYGVRR